MSNQYQASPIRLQLSPAPNPLTPPIDAATGDRPAFFRGSSVDVMVGIFDGSNNPVDLSNLSVLQLVLMKTPTSPAPVVVKTLTAAQFDAPLVSWGNWTTGIGQQATFQLTPADTDQGCDGMPQADYWLVIQGTTALNQVIIYGAGFVTLFNSGSASLMQLPSTPSYNLWQNPSGAGATIITPTTQQSVQEVQFTGAAGARSVAVATTGLLAGAIMRLICDLPATAGLVITIYSGSPTGPAVKTFTTSGGSGNPKAILEMHFDGFNLILDEYFGP